VDTTLVELESRIIPFSRYPAVPHLATYAYPPTQEGGLDLVKVFSQV